MSATVDSSEIMEPRKPRILGLTASPLNCRTLNKENVLRMDLVKQYLNELEIRLDAKVRSFESGMYFRVYYLTSIPYALTYDQS